VVTGGGNGIGRELVLQLLASGEKVAAVDIDEAGLQETASLAAQRGVNLSQHIVDITVRKAVSSLPEEIVAKWSAVDAGWVMIPDSEYDIYMQLVHAAAMEPDRAKQGEMIVAIDRLLVEEYVSVIPLITYETCVEFYQTWEEVNP